MHMFKCYIMLSPQINRTIPFCLRGKKVGGDTQSCSGNIRREKNVNIERRKREKEREISRLVKFYGISTVVGYLMPNPVYIYI